MFQRSEIDEIKEANPIEAVVARYGVELRPSGRALIGRCPFHADGGRPNLHVYPPSKSFYCYRCPQGGDCIRWVQQIEGVDFGTALERLRDGLCGRRVPSNETAAKQRRSFRPRPGSALPFGPDERACLAAAVELYENRLLGDSAAMAYVEGRGLNREIVESCRVGYAAGDELASYLRWRRIPAQAAMRVGLLGPGGRETMAGRIVVAEIRSGQPIWMVGRTTAPDFAGPRYLGLRGRKPLLGWDSARGAASVFVVEGPIDV